MAAELGVPAERIYLDHGGTETDRARPGLDQAWLWYGHAYHPADPMGITVLGIGPHPDPSGRGWFGAVPAKQFDTGYRQAGRGCWVA